MIDIYRPYMTRNIRSDYDSPIEELSLEALAPFAREDGFFTRSFDVTLKGKKGIRRDMDLFIRGEIRERKR